MHISGTTEAYITVQLVTCTPDAGLPIIIYLGLITLLVDEIYYKHWKERKHCIGFVSHCRSGAIAVPSTSARKLKKTVSMAEGSSHEMSESLQGQDRADTLCMSTSAMCRLTVLDMVKIGSMHRATQVWKCAPSVEGAGAPLDSGSSVKRQREQSPVCKASHLEGSPKIVPPAMRWDSLNDRDDVCMGAVDEAPQGPMVESPWTRRGVEVCSYLRERLAEVSAELKHLEEALFDEHELSYSEKMRAETECRRVEAEQVRASEAMRSIAHAVICLQWTVAELEVEAQEQ